VLNTLLEADINSDVESFDFEDKSQGTYPEHAKKKQGRDRKYYKDSQLKLPAKLL